MKIRPTKRPYVYLFTRGKGVGTQAARRLVSSERGANDLLILVVRYVSAAKQADKLARGTTTYPLESIKIQLPLETREFAVPKVSV